MKALCTSSSSGIHCCYITYPLQQWVNFFIAGLFTVTAVTKHFFLPWTSLANFKCTQAFTFPSAFLHDWAIFLYSSITPYPCFCLLYIIFFFVWFEPFFVLVNHEHVCLFMVSLLAFWNTSFLCLEEVCSQKSGSILKLFCPTKLHLTGSFLPLLNKSVCSSEVHNLYSSPCLPHFPQDLEFP